METFRKYPDDLFVAKEVNSSEGKKLKLDPTIKQVYLYMLLKYEFYEKETKDKTFFENQDVIGENCALSRHTIIRTIDKLVEVGLVLVRKKRLGNGAWSNNYIVNRVDGWKWWYDDKRKPQEAPKHEPIKPQWDEDCPF